MPCATSIFAARKRDAILEILSVVQGRKCAHCPAMDDLEFDVKNVVGDPKSHHGKISWAQRMRFYCRQLAAGNLQLLCSKCNSKKRWTEDYSEPTENEPF